MPRVALIAIAVVCISGLDLDTQANPIRKVVSLLQEMQKEIQQAGEKEQVLFDKFMCYCSGNDHELQASADNAQAKIAQLTSRIKSETSEKGQLAQELIGHANDRSAASKDIEGAQVLRNKEQSENSGAVADFKANIAGVSTAIPALERGMGGAALMQLPGADRLTSLLDTFQFSDPQDRRHLLAFVSENGDYAPQSGQIVGILKGMQDSMEKSVKETQDSELQSAATFVDLKASKEQEVQLATQAIAAKTERSGELAVTIAHANGDVADTEQELVNTKQLLWQLGSQCATKQTEWSARQQVRQEEVTAISQTIGILNDDDSLDLFKKAIPSSLIQAGRPVGFLQRAEGRATRLHKLQAILAEAARTQTPTSLKLLLFSVNSKIRMLHQEGMNAKQGDFSEVVKIIDDMVALLKKNQADDNKQQLWCNQEFQTAAREEVAAKRSLERNTVAIEEKADAVVMLQEEIEVLGESVKELDKSVAQATEQRKEEHAEYIAHIAMTQAAVGLIEKARNRLNKFYQPSEYVAPAAVGSGQTLAFIAIEAKHHSHLEQPATPPATYEKSGQSGGVIALIKRIVHELQLEMQDATHEEQAAQKDYSELMADAQKSRAQDAKGITDKEATKAQSNLKLNNLNDAKRSTTEQLFLVQKYTGSLHAQCDFILANYVERQEARDQETKSLQNAKSMLAGATA